MNSISIAEGAPHSPDSDFRIRDPVGFGFGVPPTSLIIETPGPIWSTGSPQLEEIMTTLGQRTPPSGPSLLLGGPVIPLSVLLISSTVMSQSHNYHQRRPDRYRNSTSFFPHSFNLIDRVDSRSSVSQNPTNLITLGFNCFLRSLLYAILRQTL